MSWLSKIFPKRPSHDSDVLKRILWELERQEKLNQERFEQIMATQAEVAQALKDQTALLVTIGDGVTAICIQVKKIGTETDTLIQKIADLEAAINAGGAASQDVTDALDALKAQVAVVQKVQQDTAVEAANVDDKVSDAPPNP